MTGPTLTLLGSAAAELLKSLTPDAARIVGDELNSLPAIEQAAAAPVAIEGVQPGYQALTTPSGYIVVYRKLTDLERKEVSPEAADSDANVYLVADLLPALDLHKELA